MPILLKIKKNDLNINLEYIINKSLLKFVIKKLLFINSNISREKPNYSYNDLKNILNHIP
jgi:hypothetical protein